VKPQLAQDDITDHQIIDTRLRRLENAQTTAPVGAIVLWRSGSGAATPEGWLVCDGTTFSASAYPMLVTLWGSTTLPADPGLTGYVAIVRGR
jgi:hypothetical protein